MMAQCVNTYGHIMLNICGSSVVKKSNTTTAEKFLQYLKMTSDILYIYLSYQPKPIQTWGYNPKMARIKHINFIKNADLLHIY